MGFLIHWQESAMDLHIFPIPIPPPTSLSTPFLWVFPVHQARALVYIAFKTYLIAFLTTDSFPRGSVIKNPPASAGFTETRVQSLGWEDLPEEGRATDSSSLAWRIPWTEEPGGLQSTVWQRVEHGWSDLAYIAHVSMNGFVYSCVCCLSCPSPVENGNIT